jgi:transcriptional regulator with XRE-family HTH domain
MSDPVSFGQYLKRLRKEQNITLHELGRRVGYTHSYISQIENGKKGIPSPNLIRSFSIELKVPYFEMMLKAGHIDDDSYLVNHLERNQVKSYNSQQSYKFYGVAEMELAEQLIAYYKKNSDKDLFQIGSYHGYSHLNFMNDELCLTHKESTIETFDALKEYINTYDYTYTDMKRNQLVVHVVHTVLEVIGLDILYNWSIEDFIKLPLSKLSHRSLSDVDRSRILDMLKLMFPTPDSVEEK